MAQCKRYTIFNQYIRGSNQAPQACHGFKNLFISAYAEETSREAKSLFDLWLNTSDIEVMLQGGDHATLERLYATLVGIGSVPCAKFNESADALCGVCTVVTLVASATVVEIGEFARYHRISPSDFSRRIRAEFSPSSGLMVQDDEITIASIITYLAPAQ